MSGLMPRKSSRDLDAEWALFAKHEKLLSLMIEAFGGYLTIKDYTNRDGLLAYANQKAVDFSDLQHGYFMLPSEKVIKDGALFKEEDLEVLDSGEAKTYMYRDPKDNSLWAKHKFTFKDGDRTYVAAVMVPQDG